MVRGDGGGNRGLFVRCAMLLGVVPLQRQVAASASAPAIVARVFVRSCRGEDETDIILRVVKCE